MAKEAFTVTFPLKTDLADVYEIERRFHALSHIHNVAVKHVKGMIEHLECDPFYRNLMAEMKSFCSKKRLTESEKERKKAVGRFLKQMRIDAGLSEFGLQKWIKPCGGRYKHMLSSTQVQKEMSNVAKGISKYFYGNGKTIHFKKFEDFDTISGKSPSNGAVFDPVSRSVDWLGLHLPCKKVKDHKKAAYFDAACMHEISYTTIKRMMFNNGWHYYAVVTFRGTAPSKGHKFGKGKAGYDPGVSTCSVVAENKAFLEELAPKCHDYNQKIIDLQWKLEASKRATNPQYFNEDGTIKKGKKKWKYSSTYWRNRQKLKCLYRKKSAYTRCSHNRLANRILETANTIYAEPVQFSAMAKRSKEAERKDTPETVVSKDGTVKEVYKYKRMKRFGKSINDRSPSLFYNTLKEKCINSGGQWIEINTRTYKASQYDHCTDTYTKHELTERSKKVGEHEVQRDLYSAFLICHPKEDLKHANRESCQNDFDQFIKIHDALISEMKANKISMKQCFGF